MTKTLNQLRAELSAKELGAFAHDPMMHPNVLAVIDDSRLFYFKRGFDAAADLVFDRVVDELMKYGDTDDTGKWLRENKERILK